MLACHIPVVPVEEHIRRQRRQSSALPQLWDLLDQVMDPEVPALSLWDLGVLQDIELQGDKVVVTITPTYSGCPALETMADDIHLALASAGLDNVEVVTRLSPAWTIDWMSITARQQLQSYGIAPPTDNLSQINCPQCSSGNVSVISEFGSTACKAMYRCDDCLEPFDYFKKI